MNMGVSSLSVVNERPAMHVTERLLALRNRAGLSRDAVAERLGYANGSSYQRYESPDRFRKESLPLDLTLKLAAIFAERGIPETETMELAGLPPNISVSEPTALELVRKTDDAPDPLGADVRVSVFRVRIVVQALAEVLAESGIAMTPVDQGEAVSLFVAWYEDEIALGRQPEELTVPLAKSLLTFVNRLARR